MGKKVAILGATNKTDRFAYRALTLLRSKGHEIFLVNPHLQKHVKEIEGYPLYASLSEVPQPFDTLTMYVGPAISTEIADEILASHPKRVIFNPGSENPALAAKLREQSSEVLNACTLVMLQANSF